MDEQKKACINKDPRIRTFVKCCWNCRNGAGDCDQELEGYFCYLDGCKVSLFQTCKDWENDA